MRLQQLNTIVVDSVTSERLARVRQKNTAPEQAVRQILHKNGFRYRKANRDLPGSPDIANRTRHWAVFVHGCFWHSHRGCPKATIPKRNRFFWLAKFKTNQKRDRRAIRTLKTIGYKCVVIWQCELEQSPDALARRLLKALPPSFV
jgi:DNA mismatch endonuclease, patch repair protein